jgi:hypothetical protein
MTSVGTFTVAGSTLESYGEWLNSGSYIQIKPGTAHYNDVVLNDYASDINLNGQTFYVDGNLNVVGGGNSRVLNNGTIVIGGNYVNPSLCGYSGTVALTFVGANPSISLFAGSYFTGGDVNVNVSGTLTLSKALTATATGQKMYINTGAVDMNGKNLTVQSNLTLSAGTTITRNGGTLNTNGTNRGNASYTGPLTL